MAQENERLRAAQKTEQRASGVKCWVKEYDGETVVTIYNLSDEHRQRLLALLVEIES
jgi:hypothetical protein